MSAPPDEENPKRWLIKHKFEEDKARRERFEKDKALKDKKISPWSREAWQAAAARNKAGFLAQEPRFPIIITSSTGPFMTSKELQEVADLSSLPNVRWTTRTSVFDSEKEDGSIDPDGEKPERVQYCDISWEQLVRVKEYSDGEDVLVRFEGKKRVAWLAHSTKQKSGNQTDDRKS